MTKDQALQKAIRLLKKVKNQIEGGPFFGICGEIDIYLDDVLDMLLTEENKQ